MIDSPKRPGPGAAKLSGDGGLKPESVLYMFMICYWKWVQEEEKEKAKMYKCAELSFGVECMFVFAGMETRRGWPAT